VTSPNDVVTTLPTEDSDNSSPVSFRFQQQQQQPLVSLQLVNGVTSSADRKCSATRGRQREPSAADDVTSAANVIVQSAATVDNDEPATSTVIRDVISRRDPQSNRLERFSTGTGNQTAQNEGRQRPGEMTEQEAFVTSLLDDAISPATSQRQSVTDVDDNTEQRNETSEKDEEQLDLGSRQDGDITVPESLQLDEGHDKGRGRQLVQLDKGVTGIGFCISGGKGTPVGDQPITVKRLFQGHTSAQAKLKVGDILLSINGKDTSTMSHYEAWNWLKAAPDGIVTLVIDRK
jgi:hypothetical protein